MGRIIWNLSRLYGYLCEKELAIDHINTECLAIRLNEMINIVYVSNYALDL